MARTVPFGTPTRAAAYLRPPSRAARWGLAAGVGGLLAAGLATLYVGGVTPVASPGPVAAGHAPIGTECAQCHQPAHGVTNLRCERCHDPGGWDRWTHASHVLLGSGDPRKAARTTPVACVQCHAEHRGRAHVLAAVDDRECSSCHVFRTLDRHPEFAAVKAAITTGVGLKFDHDRHLVEVAAAGLDRCGSCHAPAADQAGFEPIAFERHCRTCHVDADGFVTGRTDPIRPEYVLPPDRIPETWAAASEIEATPAARGRSEYGRMRHRDPWVLYNARRLRRAIAPEGETAEREALRGRIAWLERQLEATPFEAVPAGQLDAWAGSLERELASLAADVERAAPPGPEGTARALTEMAEAAQVLAQRLAAAEPAARADAAEIAGADLRFAGTGLPAADPGGGTPADLARRQRELLGVLDAIARRGDPELADRAAELRRRVAAIGPEAATATADVSAYRDALDALDEVVRAVRDAPDAEAQFDAAQLNELRAFARRRIAGGLPLEDFEARRRQVLSLLEAIDRTGDDALRGRAAPLRQRALAVQPGDDGDDARRNRLDRRRRDLDRVRLALEFAEAGRPGPAAAAASALDRRAAGEALAAARARLADLESGSRPGAALTDTERERQGATLESLLGPCLKCHELSGPRLAPVTGAGRVLSRARFDHAPHLLLGNCDTCHRSVTTSGFATDVNVPGVETCRACHRPDEARTDCAGCHQYHPPSAAALLDLR